MDTLEPLYKKLKITAKTIQRFDHRRFPYANDNANILHGLPTQEQWKFLKKVNEDKNGICFLSGKITLKDVKNYN